MKKVVGLLCTVALLCAGCAPQTEKASRSFVAMDTAVTLTAYGGGADTVLQAAETRMRELESRWSVTDAAGDVYAVNHRAGDTVTVHEDTAAALAFALEMAAKTGGALDPTVYPVLTAWGFTTDATRVPDGEELARLLPLVGYERVKLNGNAVTLAEGMQLDLGAVGKGYAGDLLAAQLKESGVTAALLDIGGNIQTVGRKPDGSDWRVGVHSPFGESQIGVLAMGEGAVVTSGSYERYFEQDGVRYGHILDPKTGAPAESGLASVTVTAAAGKLCDALSTALYVMGAEKAAAYWRASDAPFEMLLVAEDGTLYVTEALATRFTPDAAFAEKMQILKK